MCFKITRKNDDIKGVSNMSLQRTFTEQSYMIPFNANLYQFNITIYELFTYIIYMNTCKRFGSNLYFYRKKSYKALYYYYIDRLITIRNINRRTQKQQYK